MTRLVVLDNEAVQALANPRHRKHRRALSYLEAVERRKKDAAEISLVVPSAVRVEAGWDRTCPDWAFLNRLRIADVPLDPTHANTAAAIHGQARVSVADAHLGAAVTLASDADITVITSDPGDIRKVAADRAVRVIAL